MTPKSGHTSWPRWRSGGPFNTNNTKPTVNIPPVNIQTVNIPTVNMPTVNIPTVKTQKNNMRKTQQTAIKATPLARHSRKRGGGLVLEKFGRTIIQNTLGRHEYPLASSYFMICLEKITTTTTTSAARPRINRNKSSNEDRHGRLYCEGDPQLYLVGKQRAIELGRKETDIFHF